MKCDDVYKLNLNENQFRLDYQMKVKENIDWSNHDFSVYVESHEETTELIDKISEKFSVGRDNIYLTNGIDECLIAIAFGIYRLKGRIAITECTYSGFEIALSYVAGIWGEEISDKICWISVDNLDTNIDRVLEQIKGQEISAFYSCNPHNPIGSVWTGGLKRFLDYTRAQNIIVICDEAYAEYAENDDESMGFISLIDYSKEYTNVGVTRTFSKAYGLAGLRCGYFISYNEFLLSNIAQYHKAMPYSVNCVAYELGLQIIDNNSYLKQMIRQTKENRDFLLRKLNSVGLKSYPSITNFVLVETKGFTDELIQLLKDKNVMVKNASDFGIANHIRITVGRIEQMKKTISVIKDFLKNNNLNKEIKQMSNNLIEELKEVVMSISKSKQELNDDTNLCLDLGFDSVEMIELFSEVEDKCDIEFDFDGVDFEDIAVFKNFVSYVEKNM